VAEMKGFGKKKLEVLIEEAIVDAYGDEEQMTGFFTMLEEHLEVPFVTSILEVPVKVRAVELDDNDDRIVAVCVRNGKRQRVDLLDLPMPKPLPKGAEWIAAYRYWKNGQ
jgi:hypothetical protein